jgi:hypothetical protein
VQRALRHADLTTGPSGQATVPEQAEIRWRYRQDDVGMVTWARAEPGTLAVVGRVHERVPGSASPDVGLGRRAYRSSMWRRIAGWIR